MTTTDSIQIHRVKSLDQNLASSINALFDEGMTWNAVEGEKFLSDPNNILLVAYWNGALAGFLTGHRLQRFDTRKAEVLLYEVGVDENFRRKGIGKKLIEELKSWAKEVEADVIWVVTNRSNSAAVSLYHSVGGYTESDDEQMYTIKV